MLTIRGIYDGKTFRALPGEPVPTVDREVAVEITFLDDVAGTDEERPLNEKAKRLLANARSSRELVSNPDELLSPEEAGRRLDALRESIGPIGMSVRELIEEGRYR